MSFPKKSKISVDVEHLSPREASMLEDLAKLLRDLGLEHGIVVDYYAYRMRGYGLKWQGAEWVNVVVDKDKLPWEPRAPSIREVSLVSHPNYATHERFREKYRISLRLIPESGANIEGLGDEFTFPSGERLNIARPVRNVQGFTNLVRQYCNLPQNSIELAAVERWTANIESLNSAAERQRDSTLVEACGECIKELARLRAQLDLF